VNLNRFLIINADDFGRTPGVTEGILQTHQRGVVTSTTAMVNLPGAEAAVRRARAEAPEMGIGIHLNLTAGQPLLPPGDVSSLVGPDGRFHPVRRLVPRLKDLNLDQVRVELEAQIERFRSWGDEPTHLDSHHHVLYLSPHLFRVLVELAERYHLPIRYPWPREPTGRKDLARLAEAHRLSPEDLPAVIAGCHAILERSAVPTPDHCILSFYGPGATREHLLDLIVGLPEGVSELMCHPALPDVALRAQSGYAEERERELAVLTDPRVHKAIHASGIHLVPFSVLGPISQVQHP
jgi:predicted glycoside hydrolase/deacetylase ChbG (UPF0249 family)